MTDKKLLTERDQMVVLNYTAKLMAAFQELIDDEDMPLFDKDPAMLSLAVVSFAVTVAANFDEAVKQLKQPIKFRGSTFESYKELYIYLMKHGTVKRANA